MLQIPEIKIHFVYDIIYFCFDLELPEKEANLVQKLVLFTTYLKLNETFFENYFIVKQVYIKEIFIMFN